MAANRNQHFVPRFYLGHFATPETKSTENPRVWASSFMPGQKFCANTRNLAAEKDLYNYCDSEVDEKLQGLENFLSRYWHRFEAGDFAMDLTFKRTMALFLASTHLRHPKEFERHRNERMKFERIAKALLAKPLATGESYAFGINQQAIRMDRAEVEKLAKFTNHDVAQSWGSIILDVTGPFAQKLIEEKQWNILFSDEPVLITSDCPVALFHPENPEPDLLTPGAQIYFPMNPKQLLLLGGRGIEPDLAYRFKKSGEAYANLFMYQNAYRYVFSSFNPDRHIHQVHATLNLLRAERRERIQELRACMPSVKRNAACPCGSGMKFKKCCGA
jgi:hypothetical protein